MMKKRVTVAKPDNRADNEVHLQQHIDHTIVNRHEAEAYLDAHGDEIPANQKKALEQKNQRRAASVNSFIAEKKDEAKSTYELHSQ